MNPFEDFKTYFAQVASEHLEIKTFVHGDVRRFQAKSRSEMEYPCLWLETPNQKFVDNTGNTFIESTGAFVVLHNAPAGDAEGQDQIWSDTNEIALDIIARIRKDSRDKTKFIGCSNFSIDPVDTLFVANDYGWRVEFTVKKSWSLCFNPLRWLAGLFT
jgi:hypothetical protein